MEYSNELRISLWEKESAKGNSYLNGKTEIDGVTYWLTGFTNKEGIKMLVRNSVTEVQTEVELIEKEAASGVTFYKCKKMPLELEGSKYWISLFINDSDNPRAPLFSGKLEPVEDEEK
jgi:hypothetical protein